MAGWAARQHQLGCLKAGQGPVEPLALAERMLDCLGSRRLREEEGACRTEISGAKVKCGSYKLTLQSYVSNRSSLKQERSLAFDYCPLGANMKVRASTGIISPVASGV